ncbi:hypothetical protein [Kribbella deserti]|uniref:XRE family transcriptional regulator n=1 Tax=Kribbella deserti TaxID=1926257 RepID=A0ABV6QS35_9ACTN
MNAEILRATGRLGAIGPKSISDWERGWYTWPDAQARAALCAVLGAPDPEALGFENRRLKRSVDPPPGIDPELCLDMVSLARGSATLVDDPSLCVAVPAGRKFPGAGLAAALVPQDARDGIQSSRHALARLARADRRTAVLAHNPGGGVLVADGREYAATSVRESAPPPIPDAYRLDDLTIGIIWAVSNTDAAVLADDAALDSYQRSLAHYSETSTSSATLSEAPMLGDLSRHWLGSYFCAGHITRHLARLTGEPLFWTREQRGEEAASWLLWAHKLEYLRNTASRYADARRAFCIPEHEVRSSPKYERILLLLALALMEAFNIETQVTADAHFGEIEGFVLADDVIVANWLRAPSIWYVDAGAPPSRWATYREIADHTAADSIIEHPTPVGRLQAMAAYLEIPWGWLVARCCEVASAGVDGLARPRSRLLSTEGLTRALHFTAQLGGREPGKNL